MQLRHKLTGVIDSDEMARVVMEELEASHRVTKASLYLLDRHGETLAASNWRDWSSFVGNNYAFRPYFIDAVANDSGRYFAVGVTTGMMKFVANDDELAAVLGHEVAHVTANHAAERYSQTALAQVGAGLVGAATQNAESGLAQALGRYAGPALQVAVRALRAARR